MSTAKKFYVEVLSQVEQGLSKRLDEWTANKTLQEIDISRWAIIPYVVWARRKWKKTRDPVWLVYIAILGLRYEMWQRHRHAIALTLPKKTRLDGDRILQEIRRSRSVN